MRQTPGAGLLLLLCAPLLLFPAIGCRQLTASRQEGQTALALAAVQATQHAWNAGDLEGYMDGYWRSEGLRFASGGDVSYGWETVLERYRGRYPDREAMGRLVFSDLDVTLLSEEAALVFGRWELLREQDAPRGLFTLLLRRVEGRWRIVHDHTSSAAAEGAG